MLLLLTQGCGGGGEPRGTGPQIAAPAGDPAYRTSAEYDPAMAGVAAGAKEVVEATLEDPREVAAEVAVMTEPTGLTVDRAGCRVYLPAEGWVGVARFWDVYYREPDKLPGAFDHEPLSAIALEGADGEPGPGLACIGTQLNDGGPALAAPGNEMGAGQG